MTPILMPATSAISTTFSDARKRRSNDPTGTAGLRRKWRSTAELRLRQLRAQLRVAVVDEDLLGLGGGLAQYTPAYLRLRALQEWFDLAARTTLGGNWSTPFVVQAWQAGFVKAKQETGRETPYDHYAGEHLVQLAQVEFMGIASALAQQVARASVLAVTRNMRPTQAYALMIKPFDKSALYRLRGNVNVITVSAFNAAKLATYAAVGIKRVGVMPEIGTHHRVTMRQTVDWSPSQPRDPAGTPTGGQWTSGGAGGLTVEHNKLYEVLTYAPGSSHECEVLKNPPEREVFKMLNELQRSPMMKFSAFSPTVRTMVDGNQNVFVWPAWAAAHVEIARKFGKGVLYMGGALKLDHGKVVTSREDDPDPRSRSGSGDEILGMIRANKGLRIEHDMPSGGDLVDRAEQYAKFRHGQNNHVRKYTGEPYAVHLKEVADMVADAGLRPEAVAAAWLHDTLEDTYATEADLREKFGDDVAKLVLEVTDVSQPQDGNRAARKAKDREHLANASPEGKTIKLADLISNSKSILEHDPNFAKIYLAEKAALLPHLTQGDKKLFEQASLQVDHAKPFDIEHVRPEEFDFIHYGTAPLQAIRSIPVDDQPIDFKPKGLWLSVGSEWKEWANRESFEIGDVQTRIKLRADANIVRIENEDQFDAFDAKYGTQWHGTDMINWQKVAKDYQGIVIAPYLWGRRMEPMWYYTWDVASACIWDANAIDQGLSIEHAKPATTRSSFASSIVPKLQKIANMPHVSVKVAKRDPDTEWILLSSAQGKYKPFSPITVPGGDDYTGIAIAHRPTDKVVSVYEMNIAKPDRGKGIGSKMVEAVIAAMPKDYRLSIHHDFSGITAPDKSKPTFWSKIAQKYAGRVTIDAMLLDWNPDQPREPAGSSTGGQWVSHGGLTVEHAKPAAIREASIRAAKDHFGLTKDPREAGYILPDGSMLDLSGRHNMQNDYKKVGDRWVNKKPGDRDWMAGHRETDHRELPDNVGADKGGTEGMRDFMRETGAVRLSYGIGVEFATPPTNRQIAVAIAAHKMYERNEPENAAAFPGLKIDVVWPDENMYGQVFMKPNLPEIRKWVDKQLELEPINIEHVIIAPQYGKPQIKWQKSDPTLPWSTPTQPAKQSSKPLVMAEMKKVGKAMGSNVGGVYMDAAGKQYYIKQGKSEAHVRNELLAADIYKLAGTPLLHYRPVEGGKHIATEIEKLDKNNVKQLSPDEREEAMRDFAVHAWLSNWDVVGLGGDNIGTINGQPIALDLGGALEFRAQGAAKGNKFGDTVGEIDTLRDRGLNPDAAGLFGKITPAQMRESARFVTNIRSHDIRAAVKRRGGTPELADRIVNRRNDIARQAKTFGAYGDPKKAGSTVVFPAGDPLPVKSLNGIAFKPWTPPKDWNEVSGQKDLGESALPEHFPMGKQLATGLVIREPDGRIWIVRPTNAHGGYEHTFPKGRVEKELSLQANAIKEAWEETGIKAKITGLLGDMEGDVTLTRYYIAERETGDPSRGDAKESDGVLLVPQARLDGFLNRSRDRELASKISGPISDALLFDWNPDQPRDPDGRWSGGSWTAGYTDYKNSDDLQTLTSRVDSGEINDGTGGPISDEEKMALSMFSGSVASWEINAALRSGTLEINTGVNRDRQTIAGLDSMMRRARLSEDMVLYRAASQYHSWSAKELTSALEKKQGTWQQRVEGLRRGELVTDLGFISTSAIKHKPDDLVVKILAPEGSRAVLVDKTFIGYGGENEVILDRGSTLRLLGRDENGTQTFALDQPRRLVLIGCSTSRAYRVKAAIATRLRLDLARAYHARRHRAHRPSRESRQRRKCSRKKLAIWSASRRRATNLSVRNAKILPTARHTRWTRHRG